jgi:iron complex transport system ATP-binding protein
MDGFRFDNLTIGYHLGRKGEKVVARGLSATLAGGQLTCLLGRNGSGKSTLLRTLAERWKGEVAVVLTDRVDVKNMTVEEVVGLGRTPYTNFWGMLSAEDKAVVAQSMQQVGIGALARRDFSTLSDGERQKVMIAKALAQQTPLVLLDEPTAFLDYPSKREVMVLLSQLAHEQGKAVLLSTHDVELAEQYADQIWFFHQESMGDTRLLTGTAHELNIKKLF